MVVVEGSLMSGHMLALDPASDLVVRVRHLVDVVVHVVLALVLDAVLDAKLGQLLRRKFVLLAVSLRGSCSLLGLIFLRV